MRVAIYARFSSEMQDKRSIDDQVVLCRDFARQHGWTFIDAYPDYAVSGSSVHGRFAFERLVNDAKAGRFDIILAEDLDRLSRNQADIALFYERMTFVGVKLWTVLDGEIAEIHIGLKGTMSALFLKALSLLPAV
jgi:site-specific DNA recombinase